MNLRAQLPLILVAGLLWSACASSAARAPVALAIPEPPPRPTIAPVEVAEKPEPEEPPPPVADSPGGRGGRPATAPSPAPKPPAANAPPAPAATPPPATNPPTGPTPATELRPAGPSGAQTLSAQQVREIMSRTTQKLNALDRGRLSAGKRDDYDAARRFLSQADTAVKANDLLLAQSSAEKAEALADGLR